MENTKLGISGNNTKAEVASSHGQTAHKTSSFATDFHGNELQRVNYIYAHIYAYF